jgi:hypothetical protein
VQNLGLAIPIWIERRTLEYREILDQNYNEEEAATQYRYLQEIAPNSLPHFGLLVPIERTATAMAPAQRQMWFEVHIPLDHEDTIKRLLWECEQRLEYQEQLTTLVALRRVMYKKKVVGGVIFKDYDCRIRLVFDHYTTNLYSAAVTPAQFRDVRRLMAFLFTACREMQDHDIYFGEYRPEIVLYDEQNQEHPFKLMDRLVDGVDPIKRIANSLLRENEEAQVPQNQQNPAHSRYRSLSYRFADPVRDVPRNTRFVRKNEIRSIAWVMMFSVLGPEAFNLFDANNTVNNQLLERGLQQLTQLGSPQVAQAIGEILREPDIYRLSIEHSYLQVAMIV